MKTFKIKRIIRQFVSEINNGVKVKFNRKGIVASDIINKFVYLDIQACSTEDYARLQEYVKRTYNFKGEVGLLPFIILHELGHIQTAHKLESPQVELTFYSHNVRRLQGSDMPVKSINKAYSRLKLEQMANEWAFNYAKECNNHVVALKNKLQKVGA